MEKVEFGDSVLYFGDCFSILPDLDIKADAVITDSPFGITACDWDIVPPLDKLWRLFESKSKENANFVMFGAGGFTIDLINSQRPWYRYDLIWVKNNRVGFFNANLQPLRAHESIMVFGKPGFQKASTYNPLKTGAGRPRVNRGSRRKAGGVYPPLPPHTTISDGTTFPISVLAFDHDRGNGQQSTIPTHPTQKPLNLMGYLVMTYTNPGDLILEPFAGSGTTLDAAMKLNRRFIGIEKERSYFDIACKRLEATWQRKTTRRLTYISLPPNPTTADQTESESESTNESPPATEHRDLESCETIPVLQKEI